jgi:hypothetical protein
MILINADETGLGKPRWMKKIRMRSVSLKNAVKVAKFAAPIAAGFIPIGGGVISKVLNSKGGRLINKVAKSKAVRKGIAFSKTSLGRKVVGAVQNRARPQIESVNSLVPASYAPMSNDAATEQNESGSYSESLENTVTEQPVGELTPVKAISTAKPMQTPAKNNTLLYVLGAAVVGGGIYLATKKSK